MGEKTAQERAKELIDYCYRHLTYNHKNKFDKIDFDEVLYRIFYYDCPPCDKKIYHPLKKKQVNFAKSDLYTWMSNFLEALKCQRKVALRMGSLSESSAHYNIRYEILKQIFNGSKKIEDLSEFDFELHMEQKGVDMKIGIDIASLAYKKQVDRIILISGDSDFVPAAKLARREGIDFILDSMHHPIKQDLYEHIDGLRSCVRKCNSQKDKFVSLDS